MAKKLGKLALFSALAGAVAAGTYYYLVKKASTLDDDFEDMDDLDDFDEDLDDEDLSSAAVSKSRPHLSIDIDNAKEVISEKVIEKLDKTKERLEHFNVSEKIDKAKEFIGEMTSPAAEPVYTEVDMSQADAAAADEASAPSGTDAAQAAQDNTTEEFFDDSDKEH